MNTTTHQTTVDNCIQCGQNPCEMETTRNNGNQIRPWSLTQLAYELHKDLAQCRSEFERTNCRSLCLSEMRDLAAEIRQTRKLTPGEQAICDEYGL